MSKIEVSTLTGPLLNLWVAKAAEHLVEPHYLVSRWLEVRTNDGAQFSLGLIIFDDEEREKFSEENEIYSPSTDWSQGGPIIEREKIELEPVYGLCDGKFLYWKAKPLIYVLDMEGETALIAAMRCFVQSKFGEEINSGAPSR